MMTEQPNILSRHCSECGDWFLGEHPSSTCRSTTRSHKYPGVCIGCAMDIDERNATTNDAESATERERPER